MSNTKLPEKITGRISAAPNPLLFGQDCVLISWKTNDPSGSEVRVSTSNGDEKLVGKTKKQSGQTEIGWIVGSTIYEFRLYGGSEPDTLIDSVRVWRDPKSGHTALQKVADEARRGNIDMGELSLFIASLIPAYLQTGRSRQVFPVLLHRLATEVIRGEMDATEAPHFIATVFPKYLGNSIEGKIVATPNPVPLGAKCVQIAWGTNDPAGGEVWVFPSRGEKKLLTKNPGGQMEISWISDATVYDFRLYAASQPDTPIDSVEVRRDADSTAAVLGKLAEEVTLGNIDIADLSRFVATVVPHCLHSGKFNEVFPLWERHGFHVTPVHFYQPIPDTQSLPETLWDQPRKLVGIDMNDSGQLELLRKHFPKFRDEYKELPTNPTGVESRFYLNNGLFDGTDALVAYCMVRVFQPRRIIEIGSGFSSLLLAEAAARNGGSNLICIDPFPREFVRKGFPGLQYLIEKKVQDIDLDFFSQLESGDLLFIDSSHTVKIGGDVNYLFLEVVPRLKPGVIVHVHDIFLPFEYRRDWVMNELRFWSEQYLLQAFLTFNSEFEVLMANRYLAHKYPEELKAAFSNLANPNPGLSDSVQWGGGSFWMRRRSPRADST